MKHQNISKWILQTGCLLFLAAAIVPASNYSPQASGPQLKEEKAITMPFREDKTRVSVTLPFAGPQVEAQTLPRAFEQQAREIPGTFKY